MFILVQQETVALSDVSIQRVAVPTRLSKVFSRRCSNGLFGRTSIRGLRRGGFRGTRGRGRGRGPAPTEASLDADLEAYMVW
ncbi:hypothetical protein D918_07087 [Trichuris suis]|nr:hypothetical protein D918_07087 [Trichuris suis]